MKRHFNRSRLAVMVSAHLVLCFGSAAAWAGDFPAVVNSQDPRDKPSSPAEAARSLKVPEGFGVTLFAGEPDVRQPIALATDERGRLWVAENYTYAEREVNFDTNLRDRIVLFEDTDQDGRFDRRKVFWDEGQKLTSVAVGFGGVWVLCAPRLLFIPDRDRDDIPDGEPVVILDGWNDGAIRHNIVNGLRWGPDGWLYGRHGIQATSLVGKPGAPTSQRVRLNCGIWRYHPTRGSFEVVVHGTTNPWGFDYDQHGQMFFSNTVIGHLWHVVPGAHYRRMYGTDFNPHTYQLIEQCADHFHWDTGEHWNDVGKGVTDGTSRAGGGHAHCGLMIYQGDNWPARYRNTLFTVNLHGRRLNNDRLERQGAGYVAKHDPDLLFSGDPWFRGIEMVYGPDGGVFLADWSDFGECHENDGVHRTSGRIFKVTYGEPRRLDSLDLFQLSDRELVNLQLHENDWFVRHARRLLQERAAGGEDVSTARDALRGMFLNQKDPTRKLRALWCLYAIDGASGAWLVRQLDHANEHVRVWAIRLLGDRKEISPEIAERLALLAKTETSGLVRLFLASALQRTPLEHRWSIAEGLAAHSEDSVDRALPLMLWYGIEPAVPNNPQRAVSLAERSRIPLIRRYVSRRLTGAIDENRAAVNDLLSLLERHQEPEFRLDILAGMNAALRGWRQAPAPESWPRVADVLGKSPNDAVRKAAGELGVVFGDGRALVELRAIVTSAGDAKVRQDALRALVQHRSADLLPLLLERVSDRTVSTEAVRGLASYSHPDVPKLILGQYNRLSPEGRIEAINTLTSRSAYAQALLDALENGRIERGALSAYHARQIRSFADESLTAKLSKVWGPVRDSSAEKRRQIDQLKAMLTAERIEEADRSKGRLAFDKTCGKCHALYGKGGAIGPDLTGSSRQDMGYLLDNIVDPSATMSADFSVSTIATEDGRVITGVIVEKTVRTLTVQTQQERMILSRSDVSEIVPQKRSLMPDDLLRPLSEKQVLDLIAYLSGRAQVSLPESPQSGPMD